MTRLDSFQTYTRHITCTQMDVYEFIQTAETYFTATVLKFVKKYH